MSRTYRVMPDYPTDGMMDGNTIHKKCVDKKHQRTIVADGDFRNMIEDRGFVLYLRPDDKRMLKKLNSKRNRKYDFTIGDE